MEILRLEIEENILKISTISETRNQLLKSQHNFKVLYIKKMKKKPFCMCVLVCVLVSYSNL